MISHSAKETQEFAKKFAQSLKVGDVILFIGDLGAGKTTFVQGLAQGLGISRDAHIRSPTFTLVNEYRGRLPLYHIDLYRLESEVEVEGLGLEEYFEGGGVTAVEWSEKFPSLLESATLFQRVFRVELCILDEMKREILLKEPTC